MSDYPVRRLTASEQRRLRGRQRYTSGPVSLLSELTGYGDLYQTLQDAQDMAEAVEDARQRLYGGHIQRPFQAPGDIMAYTPTGSDATSTSSGSRSMSVDGSVPQTNIMKRKNPVSRLVTRSAMQVKGKLKVKREKRVKVSNQFKKAVKQVVQGMSSSGTYTTVKQGFVGNISSSAKGELAGDDLNKTQSQVVYNSYDNPPGRTLFNQLVNWNPTLTSVVIPGTGMNYFTPAKIIDAASVLFNRKPVRFNPYNNDGNLSTTAGMNTGVPNTPGQLKIDLIKSYVQFTMKNVSNRVVEVQIWECTPTLKFQETNPLESCLTLVNGFTEGTTDTNFAYYSLATNTDVAPTVAPTEFIYEPKVDPFGVARSKMGLKFNWKKRNMVLAPEETCIHAVKGPSGIFDFSKLHNTTNTTTPAPIEVANCLYKGWSVGVVISVNGDQVLPTVQSTGGRKVYGNLDNIALSCPIAVEIEEVYKVRVPEVAGFITQDGIQGTTQQLNLRKPKDIFVNFCEVGYKGYTVGNEVNPLEESGVGLPTQ